MTIDAPEPMRIIRDPLPVSVLSGMCSRQFGDLVKAVVDINSKTMVIGGELHADEEAFLLDIGSDQHDLWGINLYPDQFGTQDFVEFDSMINVRPSQQNRSRSVEDANARQAITDIVNRLVQPNA